MSGFCLDPGAKSIRSRRLLLLEIAANLRHPRIGQHILKQDPACRGTGGGIGAERKIFGMGDQQRIPPLARMGAVARPGIVAGQATIQARTGLSSM